MNNAVDIGAIRSLAAALDEMPGGCGRRQAENLNKAADRILQLEEERRDMIDALRGAGILCLLCAHRCGNPEQDDGCDGCEYAAGCECVLCECGSRFEAGRSGEL